MNTKSDGRPDDSGLSLLEVIVALTLIGIIATAAATFFISGMATNKKLQQNQVAASVAATALDAARAVSPRPPSDGEVSGLLKGRAQSDVSAAFSVADADDVADLILQDSWDPAGATGPQDDWVPLTQTTQIANSTFDVTTLIGGCYREKSASTDSQDCVVAGWNETDYSLIYRVRAVVTWDGKNCADAEGCSYRATALIDPTRDYLWNTNLKPFAFDDEMKVDAGDQFTGSPVFTAVLGNDEVVSQDGDVPVNLTSSPLYGNAANYPPGVTYQPTQRDLSGKDEFTYKLIDAQGRHSEDATVRVRILPNPQDDDGGAVAAGEQLVIDVIENDYGKDNIDELAKELILSLDPDIDQETLEPDDALIAARQADQIAVSDFGLSVNSDNEIVYDAPTNAPFGEIMTFYYWLADVDPDMPEDGERYVSSHPAKVTVLIGECLNIADLDFEIPADQYGDFVELLINERNNNKASCQIKITGTNYSMGEVRVGTGNYNQANNNQSNRIYYRMQEDRPYLFEIHYMMYSADGSFTIGEERTITVKIIPVANDDAYLVGLNQEFRPANDPVGKLRANDFPSGGNQVAIKIVQNLGSNCGSFTQGLSGGDTLNNDGIVYRAPNVAKTCTFTYRLVPTDPALVDAGIQSNVAQVTFTIGNSSIHDSVTSVFAKYERTPGITNSAAERAEQIKDKNSSTKWFVGLNRFSPAGTMPIEVIYTLSSSQTLSAYSITSANDDQARDPRVWRVYGSSSAAAATNPGHNSWTQIDIQTGANFAARFEKRTFPVTNPGSYRYYKLQVTEMRNSTIEFQIADWTLEY